jgi:uncharacterized protein
MPSKMRMQQIVIDLLKDNLPPAYYYHNTSHTLYVQEKAIQIGRHEHCNEKEIELLSAAALWHDTGYIRTYNGHEEESCRLAEKYLPEFEFTTIDIGQITGMIMATKMPQQPHNKLQQIIADADLEYLGTLDAAEKARLLFKELQSLTPSLTEAAWNKMQIAFLQSHHYFTKYCNTHKEPVKQDYLNELLAQTS